MISLALARLARTFRGLVMNSTARSTAAASNAEIALTAEQAASGLVTKLSAAEQARLVGEIETLTYHATKEALKISRGTKIVVEEAIAAAEAAGAATDLISARAVAYAAAERLAAQSATQATAAFEKAYGAALALLEHGNVVRSLHGAPLQTEALINAVIETTTNAAQAAKNYAYFTEQAALKAEQLVVLAEGEQVAVHTTANAVGAAGAVAISVVPNEVKASENASKTKPITVSHIISSVAHLDPTGVDVIGTFVKTYNPYNPPSLAELAATSVDVAMMVTGADLVDEIPTDFYRSALPVTAAAVDAVVAVREAIPHLIDETSYAIDAIKASPLPLTAINAEEKRQEVKDLNRIATGKFPSNLTIPEQKPSQNILTKKTESDRDAVWSAAAGENYTPDLSLEVYESVDPSFSRATVAPTL